MTESKQVTINADDQNDQAREIIVRANYELFVLALVILQIINSVLFVLLRHGEEKIIPAMISGVVAIVLIGDALYRIWKWKNRRRALFHYYGYLLVLGSLPIPFMAVFRLLWIRMLLAKLRRSDMATIPNIIIRKQAQSAMLGVMLAAVLMLEISSILIIYAETPVRGSNIKTAGDAIWWSLVTMATVGYGDKFPVTTSGRVIGVFMMFIGVAIFTVLTSFLTESFTRPRQARGELRRVNDEEYPQDTQTSIDALRDLIDQQEQERQASMQKIQAKLSELEKRLALEARHPRAQATLPGTDAGDSGSFKRRD